MVPLCNGGAQGPPTESKTVSRVGLELSMVLNQIASRD